MPLQGADEAGLFCIMLPQSLDRSMKALESFRPYEHGIGRDDTKPFANDFVLLASRDKDNGGDVLGAVRNALDPAELERIANRSSSSRQSARPTPRPAAGKAPQSGGQPRFKRKQTQTNGEDSISSGSVKRSKQRPLKGPKMGKQGIVPLTDDDLDDTPLLPNARSLTSKPRVQQQTPVSPSSAPNPSPAQANPLPVANMNGLQFTDEQTRRIHFIWKFEVEGAETEMRYPLSEARTFRGLLDSFREEAGQFPSAAQQIEAKYWLMKYELADGQSKSALVKPSSTGNEHSFDSILRHLSETEGWKKDKRVIVEIELIAQGV